MWNASTALLFLLAGAPAADRSERPRAGERRGANDKSAPVFTFFTFEGEEGRLQLVPQDPIKLDQLKKKNKVGYLVFVPLRSESYKGEVGIAMDGGGKITRIAVHAN